MSSRLELALRNVNPGQWEQFESLSSQFLIDEFQDLRTLASPSGDEGRDAILWQPVEIDSVAIQYSISRDWDDKVRRTLQRISAKHPEASVLIYLTNQRIGASGDSRRKKALSEHSIHLDIRDQSWFTERESSTPARRKAANWFSNFVLRDLLSDSTLIDRSGTVLSGEETRAALLYLVLQREDDDLDRHLTKLCYDALVRMVLRDTDSDRRKSRGAIHKDVCALLPTHAPRDVTDYVDRALERMNKRYVRHWTKEDEYCLTFDERQRIAEAIAELRLSDVDLEQELMSHADFVARGLDLDISIVDASSITSRMRRVLEEFLFERGEDFVTSLESGQVMMFVEDELHTLVERDLARLPDSSSLRGSIVPLVARTLERSLLQPSSGVQAYLRAVGDAYTLLAFLRETPNVQAAVSKLFSNGEIWIDTTALLPVFAEELLEPKERSYSALLSAVTVAGAHLYATPGVLSEVNSHIDNSLLASRLSANWKSRTPFLFSSYLWAGYELGKFAHWVERFKGQSRPIEDLQEYLLDVHEIRTLSLEDDYLSAPDQLRWQADDYWQKVHEKRRAAKGASEPVDPEIIKQLASHDAENFLGVLQRRKGEQVGNPFGYSTWWLTLDRSAIHAASTIADQAGLDRLDSPVLSFDFLSYYLAVAPARRRLGKSRESQLPLMVDTGLTDSLPRDLLRAADEVRASMEGQDERVIRRRIRDHLDSEKLRGNVGRTTIEAILDDIRQALLAAGRR